MKKVILLIDAGYLQNILRDDQIICDADAIVNIAHACVIANEELHKIMYYDCNAFDPIDRKTGKPHTYLTNKDAEYNWIKKENTLIAVLEQKDLFAIRLGVLKFDGWNAKGKPTFRQKGVDMRIGLDMAHLAHQNVVDRIILITGDTDFIPAMKYVRKSGIQIVLTELSKKRLSPELTTHADFVRSINLKKLGLMPFKRK
ncbi:MAG: NYN domain-containing protein [Gammaproteobacteria bacterium]|uniref:NYN domain-containing protein n=1 Tax=hydrothermal vent metagenome TaxID=652676 RepID=A0A1W1E150_9ZZZZ|nr:NYN domain-containing protein [Gammaproteobacteria bacterium]